MYDKQLYEAYGYLNESSGNWKAALSSLKASPLTWSKWVNLYETAQKAGMVIRLDVTEPVPSWWSSGRSNVLYVTDGDDQGPKGEVEIMWDGLNMNSGPTLDINTAVEDLKVAISVVKPVGSVARKLRARGWII